MVTRMEYAEPTLKRSFHTIREGNDETYTQTLGLRMQSPD
jgi:hypothetical protein